VTIAIPPIGATPPLPPAPQVAPSTGTGSGFADVLSQGVDNLTAIQQNADSLALKVATGSLQNPQDYLIAANEASMATQMTVALRNKALDAFNEIMRMPL